MMPSHVTHTTAPKLPPLLTEEQVLAELRGLPLDLIKALHPVDITTLDQNQLDYDPYDDPEADEEDMVDVTPKGTTNGS
jgi:hypothetical protein